MKEFHLLVWLAQLGLSTFFPLAGFILLGVWLYRSLGWGMWVIFAGLILGLICAANGFRDSLKAMERMSRDKKTEPPPIAFNDHK